MKNYLITSTKGLLVCFKNLTRFIMEISSTVLYGQQIERIKWRVDSKADKTQARFDSRNIPPARRGNETETNLLKSGGLPIDTDRNENLPREINYILDYIQPEVHASIYWFKYHRDRYSTELLAKLLWEEIIDILSNTLDARQNIQKWFISPAPSTSYLTGEKKWDHCVEILSVLKESNSESLNFKFLELFTVSNAILEMNNKIENNKKLGRKSRIQNSADKFALRDSVSVDYRNDCGLIIFDDVTTTGSTLLSLRKLADQSNKFKKVILVALAH